MSRKALRHLRSILQLMPALVPTVAGAIDWSGMTGSFGTGANWAGGVVPAATTANIANSGTAAVTTGNAFSVTTLSVGNFSGIGSILQDGGSITATSQVMIGGTNANGGTGVGTFAMSGGTLTSTSGNEFWVGTRGGTGTLSLSGDALVTTSGTTNIGRDTGGKGTLKISGNAELRTTANDINVGVANGNANSSITVENSGKLTCGREITVGLIGSAPTQGNLIVKNDAFVSTVLAVVIGKLDSAKGIMTVSDNSTVTAGTYVIVGADSTLANGALTLNGNATVNSARQVWLGIGGSTASLTINGGTLKGHAYNGEDAGAGVAFRGGNNVMALNGGTLETPGIHKAGGAVSFLLNGGLIRLAGTTNTGELFNAFGNGDINIQAGGAKIDTNGFNIQVSPRMSGTGGLTKSGAGTLALNGVNTYSGATMVSAGILSGSGTVAGALTVLPGAAIAPGVSIGVFTAGATTISGSYSCEIDGPVSDKLVVSGTLDVSGATLAITELNPAEAPVMVIASYTGSQPTPFASVTGLPAGYTVDYNYLGGNQIALVQPGGSPFGAWISGFFPGEANPAVVGPEADPDKDGGSNSLEFALGGDPNNGPVPPRVHILKPDPTASQSAVLTIAVRAGTPAFTGSPSPSATKDGYTYSVNGTNDLTDFTATVVPVAPVTTGLPSVPMGYEYRTFSLVGQGAKGFMRVEISPYAGENLAVGNFDGPNYGSWTTTGTAFSQGPATGPLIAQLGIQNADGGVASSEIQGDGPMGTLTSGTFMIARRYISYSIAGGDYEHHACLNLLIDGKVVKSATGRNNDSLTLASWDVRPFIGKAARIQIVDEAQGAWGHVNVGRIVQTDAPQVLPLAKGVLYQESLRPQVHFTARQWTMDRLNPGQRQEGWLNDLNGMIYYEGEYHLFAQRWNKCWIHAVSTDLVHWEELAPAFWEEGLGTGVQSGACVIDYQNTSGLSSNPNTPPMVAFWSRNDDHSHCISYSLDKGRTWTHYAGNPILDFPERDPKVFWHAPTNRWVMMMYGGGKYHIFTSTNLLNWQNQAHPINNAFECPDFFELPVMGNPSVKKWVLVHADGKYSLGTFDGTQFVEETPRYFCDVGGYNFYATQSFNNVENGDGRRIQLAWIRGSDFANMPFSQQVSFPCEMTLHQTPAGLRIFRQPVAELDLLHEPGQTWSNLSMTAGQQLSLASSGDLYRIQAQVTIPAGSKLTFNLRGFPVALTSTTLDSGSGPYPVQGQISTVEILLDRASVESFANTGEISCTRFFQPTAAGLSVKAEGAGVVIHSMTVNPLKSMWADSPAN
ncbi:MAG: autotransporter-associated beta strand repeat-containing protein [Luteolibacter sp.]|uniref:autotransporter-associated beta strand repeat-containing protein n=1 Tax=Luteolibacter sp. TaxID=1962973 RepID=UPI0032678ADC